MAPDGQTLAPNVHDAEPIPEAARAEIDRLDEVLVRLFAERAGYIDRAAQIKARADLPHTLSSTHPTAQHIGTHTHAD